MKQCSLAAAAILISVGTLAGCGGSSTRATGQVDSVSAGRICFTPENNDRHELEGCFSIGAADAEGIEQSDCIEARFPADDNDLVTDVRLLDRECHVGVEPKASTGTAIASLLGLVAVSIALVFCALIPLRRYYRNNPETNVRR